MSVQSVEVAARSPLRRLWRLWWTTPRSFRIGSIILLLHAIVAASGPFWAT